MTQTFSDKSNFTSGTPALTSRGFVEEDFVKVAEYFDAAVNLAVKIKAETKGFCKPLFPLVLLSRDLYLSDHHLYLLRCSVMCVNSTYLF